ncbi:MAG: trypsin-like peptidase domain-containing protein [Planctomycetes bacterium]|nr:trypsin-like peptidase domain-containing protein [Planctomycetota bacterium]
MNNQVQCGILALCLLFVLVEVAGAQDIAQSVVRIHVADNGSTLLGSGFVWDVSAYCDNDSPFLADKTKAIVTAFHCVSRGEEILVDFCDELDCPAEIVVVDLRSDLALLAVKCQRSKAKPVRSSIEEAKDSAELQVVGYPWGRTAIASNRIRRRRLSGATLQEIVSKEVMERIGKAKILSATLQIVDLEGEIGRGFSGSPIVDSAGGVVAVASGCVGGGLSVFSWGIPVANVEALASRISLPLSDRMPSWSIFDHTAVRDLMDDEPRVRSIPEIPRFDLWRSPRTLTRKSYDKAYRQRTRSIDFTRTIGQGDVLIDFEEYFCTSARMRFVLPTNVLVSARSLLSRDIVNGTAVEVGGHVSYSSTSDDVRYGLLVSKERLPSLLKSKSGFGIVRGYGWPLFPPRQRAEESWRVDSSTTVEFKREFCDVEILILRGAWGRPGDATKGVAVVAQTSNESGTLVSFSLLRDANDIDTNPGVSAVWAGAVRSTLSVTCGQ